MPLPLVLRPAYGYGRPALPVGESKLPSGGPGGKGMPVDPGIPGSSTFDKPEEDIREPGHDDESIHRIDGPDDLLKDRSKVDTREDNADKHDGIGYTAPGPYDTPMTKYPYRDDKPNAHNASARIVLGMYLSALAHEAEIALGEPARVAATIAEVEAGLSKKVQQSASKCSSTLKRADKTNLRWIFSVDCGNGPKVVRMKATRKGNAAKLAKMQASFSCSCPAWQWLGPEHNAQKGGYLDGKPRGTASEPNVKDPPRQNKVCKHVASVLGLVRGWEIPK